MQQLKDLLILVVEDDKTNRNNLIENLKMRFSKILDAQNGDEGLKKFKKFKPNLVITDIAMPIMDGLDMAKEIRKISKDTPIIVLSTFSDKERLLKSIDVGIDKYLIKPVDLDELFKILYALISEKIKSSGILELSKHYKFDSIRRVLIRGDVEIELTKKELAFISLMIENFGSLVSHEDIKKNVWGNKVSDTAVRTFIKRIRDKIGERFIKNLSGLGYKLEFR